MRTATHYNTLQHSATHCNALQHMATHCNTLQHTATHQDVSVRDLRKRARSLSLEMASDIDGQERGSPGPTQGGDFFLFFGNGE